MTDPTLAPTGRPLTAPASFHVLAKPSGPICNLDCEYCFFLSKEALYPGDRFRMGDDVLVAYLGQLLAAHTDPEVTIAWQGGEPTLMGVDFFRRAVALADELRRPGQVLHHTMQTNATLLTDEWCAFLHEHRFLVGVSIDGPRDLHDVYRVDKRGGPTYDKVIAGLRLLQAHDVDVNVLCTVNAANQDHPLEVYRHFRDDLGLRHVQLIPIVERDNATGFQEGDRVTDRSVDPAQWGAFLLAVFDEWVRHDVGTVFVQMFDAALASWLGAPAAMCIFAETCGNALALSTTAISTRATTSWSPTTCSATSCRRRWWSSWPHRSSARSAPRSATHSPATACECPVRFACNGECPKNRFATTPDGEGGLNHLCAGYRDFFLGIDGVMRLMADRLRAGGFADEVMTMLAHAPRNEPCPCGSGRKAKHCHAR